MIWHENRNKIGRSSGYWHETWIWFCFSIGICAPHPPGHLPYPLKFFKTSKVSILSSVALFVRLLHILVADNLAHRKHHHHPLLYSCFSLFCFAFLFYPYLVWNIPPASYTFVHITYIRNTIPTPTYSISFLKKKNCLFDFLLLESF